ncbi:MAG: dUTP diphosphatase [Prevotellaceae bacterium]|jgi:dUTP pyrophosphatase|nr:dUTP diphosphatase [Prevotellaceae bacterium]
MEVKVINASKYPLPQYATEFSVGLDLHANVSEETILKPMQRMLVPTGIFIELPDGYEAQIRPRSGLASKFGITIINAPATIDPDYRGELKVPLVNLSTEVFMLKPGERIAQMVLARFERICWKPVEALSETARGAGGFGHTGLS